LTTAVEKLEQRKQIRRIVSMVRPYLPRIFFCLLIIFAATSIQLLLPVGIQRIFDQMLDSGDVGAIHLITVVLLAIFVLRSVLSFFGQFLVQVVSDRIIVDLRYALFRHLHALEMRYHHQQRVGDLLSRLSNDVSAIRSVVANLAISLIINLFMLVGASCVMLWMNWKLGLIVLAVGPLTTVITHLFTSTFKRLSAEIQDQLAQSSIIAQESLSGVELIKNFARGTYEAKRYRDGLSEFLKAAIRARKIDSVFNAIVAFVASASTIAIFWFGGLQVISGALSAGTLVAFLLYSQNITGSIGSIAQQYSSFMQAMGASRRVFEILDTEPAITDRPDAVALEAKSAILEFEKVTFSYRDELPVLHGISFRALPGETVALVGPSGSGKSTLLKLVSRLYDPDGGTISINGRDLRDYTQDSLREAVAVVSQDVFLFGSSVRDNIRYGRLDATDAEVEDAARAANAHDFVTVLPEGYDTLVGERGVQLSGGQRQRVAIARALLKDAPILLLDEATSSVDAASEASIQEAIERLKANRTTLVIAHRLATVRNADQILVVAGGRVAARPSYEALIAQDGHYAEWLRKAVDDVAGVHTSATDGVPVHFRGARLDSLQGPVDRSG
jgi:ATP-binding cassette, subfamily B, bacterial MsbA